MKKSFRKVLAIMLTLTMAMPTVMANPVETEATTDYLSPDYLYEFNQDYTNTGSAGQATAEKVGNGQFVEDAERGWVFDNASGTTAAKGTNYVKLPTSFVTDLADETAMTIGMWVKLPTGALTDISGGWAPIFTMTNSTADWQWFTMSTRGTVHVNHAGYFDNNAINEYNGYLDDQKWHYLAATVTSSKVVTYIDGVIFNSLDRTDTATVFSNVYDIVAIGGNQNHLWADTDSQIYIDDAAIWFEELTASDIQYLATGERAAAITGISAEDVEMVTGQTVKIEATYQPAETGDFGFTLESSDENIVTVDGVNIFGVSAGTATVTITSTVDTSVSSTFEVTVNGTEWGTGTTSVIDNTTVYKGSSTGFEKLVGDFNITYTFKNTSTTDNRWENFFLQIMDADKNTQLYRCDAWCDSNGLGTGTWTSDIDWGDEFVTFTNHMKDADVVVNIVRQGAKLVADFTMTYTDGEVDTATCTVENENLPNVLFVNLTSGFSKLSDIELTSLVQTVGAQVNTDNNTDLGFVTTIDKNAFAAIGGTNSGVVNNLKMGVLLKNSANPTTDAMILENADENGDIRKIETSYVATLDALDGSGDVNTYAFRSVVKGIIDGDKEYTAVPYVTYTIDEVEYTIYGPEITRSINYVLGN